MLSINTDLSKSEILSLVAEFSDEYPALKEISPSWRKGKIVKFINDLMEKAAAEASEVTADTVMEAEPPADDLTTDAAADADDESEEEAEAEEAEAEAEESEDPVMVEPVVETEPEEVVKEPAPRRASPASSFGRVRR